MIHAIKEICIFMLIAQAILFFVPGGTYVKYVRILVGILTILRITEPFLTIFSDEDMGKEIQERMAGIFEEAEENGQMLFVEDGNVGIYKGIEAELKKKIASCGNDYTVKDVAFDEEKGTVTITVESRREEEAAEDDGKIRIPRVTLEKKEIQEEGADGDNLKHEEIRELKEQYGNCIGVDPESIVIRGTGEGDRG